MSLVEIHYLRPPGRTTIFRQRIVERTTACVITLLEHAELSRPVSVHGRTVLEHGSPVVWFTFPGLWHDIGRFHSAEDRFTGFYANVLTPVQFVTPLHWETTDLCLDVWVDDRGAELLDADELDEAEAAGAIAGAHAARARSEAAELLERAAAGTWPPPVCREWTLERARTVLRNGGTPEGTAV